jgi:hypothetical protein
MEKYKLYYYIVIFLIIKCIFGVDIDDLKVNEITWKEETEGNIGTEGNIVKFFYTYDNSFTRMTYKYNILLLTKFLFRVTICSRM